MFALPDALRAELGDRLPEDAEEVVLARRVSAEGRTRAYLGGRSATAADLRDVGGALLSFYGQHEHRKLTLASAQLEILDGFCGAGAGRAAAGVRRRLRARAGAARRGSRSSQARAGARDRELDLLEWELQEIDDADAERGRGGRAGRRARAAAPPRGAAGRRGRRRGRAGRRRRGRGDEGAAAALARRRAGARVRARRRRRRSTRWPTASPALAVEADDLAAELRRYGEGVEATPGRLDEVEERLALLDRLKRKHGGTLAAVLAHAEECRRRRDELAGAEEALEGAQAALGEARRGARASAPRELRTRARGRRRRARRTPCASGWPSWRWTARRSRPR